MKFDASEFGNTCPAYDVCVIGSGPSGLTTALQLKSRGLRICVLESGDFRGETPAVSQLKAVESDGIVIRPDSRARVFGGTSTTWSGFIAPLDPIDFDPRPGVHDGWPIRPAEIQTFLDLHGHRYGLPPESAFTGEPSSISQDSLKASGVIAHKIFLTQAPAFNFGKTFGYAFLEEGFDVIANATVTHLKTLKYGTELKVDRVEFRDGQGKHHYLNARFIVLAASAIESIRILWNSDELGNEHDQLGRYFMNHPKGDVAKVAFRRPLAADSPFLQKRYANFYGYVGLRLSEEEQRKTGFLNSYIRLEPLRDAGQFPKAKELSLAFRTTVKSIRALDGRRTRSSLSQLARSFTGLGQLIVRGWTRTLKRQSSTIDAARVRCFVEMEPNVTDRVSIGNTLDDYGVPVAKVQHSISALAFASVDHLLTRVSEEFLDSDVGQVTRLDPSLPEILNADASHHLGGARMGQNPATSVVDTSLRVHSTNNLYLTGGAVFPTGGNANPTMTMIGLSIRLAETIAARMVARTPSEVPRRGAAVLVVGAGRRVSEDVIPAIEALGPMAYVAGIFATTRKGVFGSKYVYDSEPLETVTEEKLAQARLVYVAVPPKQLSVVLTRLVRHDCNHLTLVIDTPAVAPQDVSGAYSHFHDVIVAEDAAFLPWIDLVKERGPVADLTVDRSGYRYHAVAMARALAGNPRPHTHTLRGKRDDVRLSFATGVHARILGPRNYESGTLSVTMTDGKVISSHSQPDTLKIEPIIEGHFCTSFRLGDATTNLSREESRLLGRFLPSDTIVSRMLDLKRIGLYRMLKLAIEGKPSYTLEEALDDNRAKW